MNSYLAVLKKYAVFSGRSSRKEFWMFALINFAISIGLMILDAVTGLGFIYFLYLLGLLIPSVAVQIRRLHDTDRSGWWVLIGAIPLIGLIVLIIFFASAGTPSTNRFGEPPQE